LTTIKRLTNIPKHFSVTLTTFRPIHLKHSNPLILKNIL
jgi:hypothetical protein